MTNLTPDRTTQTKEEQLELWVDRLLREQPDRLAPDTLELRVLDHVRQHALRSWWLCNYSYWPVAARIALVMTSIACGLLGVRVMTWITVPMVSTPFAQQLPGSLRWIEALYEAITVVMNHLPPLWMYGVLTVLAVLYGALFGLGAAAYRTLYVAR